MDPYTVVLVEDQPDIREHLAHLVDDCGALRLKAATANCAEALAALREFNPDVLLVDLGLPDGSGISLISALDTYHLDTQALVITGFSDEYHVFKALEAGASGYISKRDNSQKIVDAIQQMMQGGAPVSPLIARLLLDRFQNYRTDQPGSSDSEEQEETRDDNRMANSGHLLQSADTQPVEALTTREADILNYVSKGLAAKEIANLLDLSYYTITTHIKNIYRKLKVNNRVQAVFEATHLGLIKSNLHSVTQD